MSTELPTNPETPPTPLEQPAIPIPDGRVNNGGKREGSGLPKGTKLPTKRTYSPRALAEVVTTKLITGRKIIPTPQTGPISEGDRELLARIAGVSVETFNEMFSQDLREVSVLATARMKEKLLSNEVKAEALAFMMTSATDKRLALDGSRALHNAAINVTVNQFGPSPKTVLLSELDGLSNAKQVSPIELEPAV